MYIGRAGSLLFQTLASRATSPKLSKSVHNSDLLDFWGKVPASRAGTSETLPAHHENPALYLGLLLQFKKSVQLNVSSKTNILHNAYYHLKSLATNTVNPTEDATNLPT